MGHQALHFSKAIQRSVGWPFCVERREGRGSDEEAPSISPMRGSARYCPKKVCKLQSSYICVMNKKSTKNNEAYKRTKIGINF